MTKDDDSVAEGDDEQFAMSESQRHDLARRLKARDANPKSGAPWAVVKARLMSRSQSNR